ncbi:hypothetical protein KIPE111705_46875 [Kibdelosporangium persicum]
MVKSSSTSTGWASSTMKASRSSGYAGSNGKNAPPAFTTPNTATTTSTERDNRSPTTDSATTPRPRNHHARRFDRTSNSAYVRRTSPAEIATAWPSLATCSANSSVSVRCGTSRAECCHSSTMRRRCSVSSRSTWWTGSCGSAVTWSSRRAHWARNVSMVERSNRSVAYSTKPSSPPPSAAFSAREIIRSNRAVPALVAIGWTWAPGTVRSASGAFCSTIPTWNNG